MKKILVRTIKTLVGIEITWLLLANLFLNTGLGTWAANIKAEKFSMDWDSAWSLYPAHVNASGLTINIHTWTMDVVLRTDSASARVRILPLLGKRVVIDNLKAGTVGVVLVRQVPEGERPAPAKTSPGTLFELRNMEIDSIDQFMFNQLVVSGGKASATGSASFQIRGETGISDIDASWQSANIMFDETELAESLSVNFQGDMAPFFPKKDKGLALLEKLSGEIDIRGFSGSLVPLKLLFPGTKWIERIDGQGEVDINIELESGRLQPGSVIDVAASGLELDFLGFRATGSGQVDAVVSETEGARSSVIDLVFDQFGLQRKGDEDPLVTGKGLSLTARTPELGLVEGLSETELVLEIPNSEIPDVSFLASRLPEAMAVSIDRGKAVLNGQLKVSGKDKEATGKFQLLGHKLGGKFRNMDYEMDLELNSHVSGQQLDDFRVELNGTEFKLFNGVFDNEAVEVDKAWWMTVAVPAGAANLAQPLELEADVDLSMKDTRAIIAMFAEVKEWIRHFDGILTVNDVSGSAKLIAADQKLSVRDLSVNGDKLEFMAQVEMEHGQNNSIFWGKLGILSFGLERINEQTDWKMINGQEWYQQQKAENWSN